MENQFCYLKGMVDCESGVIQNCNNMRATVCPLEQEKDKEAKKGQKKESKEKEQEETGQQGFCYLKGLVYCDAGRLQDCNIKRVTTCPKD